MKTKAFIITSLCERNCVYCINKEMQDISFSEFKKQLDDEVGKNKSLKKIVITGGNPELNKDFFIMCEYVKKKELKLKVAGTYFNKLNLNKYIGLVDEVSVALDSLDQEINDHLRGFGAFDLSQSAISFFTENKIKIQIHTVVSSVNVNELTDFYKTLVEKDFFKNNSWKLFRYTNFKNNPDLTISDMQWEKVKKLEKKNEIVFVDDVLSY